jgi:hypothetical protein
MQMCRRGFSERCNQFDEFVASRISETACGDIFVKIKILWKHDRLFKQVCRLDPVENQLADLRIPSVVYNVSHKKYE